MRDDQKKTRPFGQRLGDIVCSFQPQLFYLFIMEIVLLILALFSLLYVEPGTISYGYLQIDLILFGVTLTPIIVILYHCSQRDQY